MSPQAALGSISKVNVSIWMLMSLQAGAINVGGFLACQRFVTHTTGFATHFGAELALGHWKLALGMLMVPLYFLLGAAFSSFWVDRNIFLGKTPKYKTVFSIIAAALLAVAYLGHYNLFGKFGHPLSFISDFALLATLAFTSGLQNATITSSSGAVIRTTHLTGITTDLGIGVVRALDHKRPTENRHKESIANWIRMGLIVSFIIGSGLGAILFIKYEYWGFLGPAMVSIAILALTHKMHRRPAK